MSSPHQSIKQYNFCITYQVERRPVKVGVFFTQHTGVDVLEDLVEAKLADTLQGVANSSGGPSQEQIFRTALLVSDFESIAETLVLLLVDLISMKVNILLARHVLFQPSLHL